MSSHNSFNSSKQPLSLLTMHNISFIGEGQYEIWAMKMEYWIQNADHNLWRIVQQGNSPKRLGKDAKGNTIVHPPVSLDEHVAVQRENKVRTLLLQALPEDHMPDFHHYDDARDIWIAVKARFGGNGRNRRDEEAMLKQQTLPSSWSQVALALKTRGGLESMSFDDLYNKLRSLELDVRIGHSYGVKAAAAPTHSAFIRAASSCSKSTYSDQQNIVSSVSQTSGRSDNIMEFGDGKNWKLSGQWYSACKVTEVKTDETKSFGLSCSMVNWSDHAAENKTGEVEKFAMMGISYLRCMHVPPHPLELIAHSYKSEKMEHSLTSLQDSETSMQSATVSAGRPVSAGWLNPAARPYFRPSSVYFNNMYWPDLYDPMYMNKGRWSTAVKTSAGSSQNWLGSLKSMTGNKEKLDDFVQIKGGVVKFGGGDGRISGKGTIRTSKLDFENVYYVEELQHFNLFSVSQICDKKNKVLFTDTDCLVLSEEFQLPDESQVVLRIPREHDLYTFHISDLQPEQKVTCLVAKASLDESTRWHRRMAHVNFKTINKLAKEGLVDGLPLKVFTNEHNCVACNKGKQHKASYKHISAVRLITESLQLLHMDLFGPTNIRSIDQKYYSLVVTDDFSRFTWTFYLGTKDETFYVLKEFIALIENQLNKKVKGIRCDNGTEFKNAKLIELCGEKGIKRDYSNPRTPQQNGVAERKNRTLIEAARTTICHLQPFGCQVTILNTSDHLGKFEGKADEGYLVGYAPNSKAYRGIGHEWYFDLDYLTDSLGYTRFKSDTPAGTQETNVDAGTQDHDSDSEVDEHVIVVPSFPSNSFAGPSSGNGPSVMERNADFAEELAKLQRQEYEAKDAAARYGYLFSQATAEILSQAEAEIRNRGVSADRDPAGIGSAGGVSAGSTSAGSDPAGSHPAGSFDPAALDDPAVSTSVSADFIPVHADESTLPPGQVLGSSENTTRFPVPSDVCKDQISSGIFTSSSYDDDFRATLTNLAPAVEVNPVPTTRARRDATGQSYQQVWKIVPLPDSVVRHRDTDKRGHWIYDGSFAPVARIEAIRLFLAFASYMGFLVYQLDVKSAFLYEKLKKKCNCHSALKALKILLPKHVYRRALKLCMDFIKHLEPGMQDCLLFCYNTITEEVYVDDIIFGSTNKAWCDEFEVLMKGEFEMSAMGEMTFFLGLQVKQLPDGIFISQDKYVKDMLTKFDMESVRTATTPYEAVKTKLKDETDPPVNVHLHQVTPLTSHLNAVKKIFKYLKGQPKLGLWYPKDSPFQLEAYSDSDYAGSHGDRNHYRWMSIFWAAVISWQCKKQTIVGYFFTERSRSCIRVQDIEITASLLREPMEELLQVLKIHTDDNVADLLTKAFDGPRFAYLVVHIGMVVNTAARCTFFLLTGLVSAGRTMVLLVVILSAGRLVSAGSTMILLVVIVPAGCFVSAGCMFLLSAWFLLAEYIHAAGAVYAANTSIHAAGLVCAGSIMFLLADLFLLVVTCFCCAQLDIAGWLVSATSHLVSAGSLHSCWCNNVSAA
ncbi:putative ribonuclease H-like domain-containing protein [Tanacetum coccineum]